MDSTAGSALTGTLGGLIGAWIGGFIIPMMGAYIFLRLADSPNRKPIAATGFRILAVLTSVLLMYAGYIGGGGHINYGGLSAVIISIAWALKKQFERKPSQ